MKQINLQQTLPGVFADRNTIQSDVWHQDLTFHKENYYLIEAESGGGKSSLCSYIYGYRNDYQGIITFDGQNIKQNTLKEWIHLRKTSIGLLFQELRLFPELTALENVLLKNKLTHYKKNSEIRQLFQQLDIEEKLHQKVGKLSFGQQQRVAFIRTLCQPLDFILLDEPVSHLDDTNNRRMSQLLLDEAQAQGCGIIVTSIGKPLELPYHETLKL